MFSTMNFAVVCISFQTITIFVTFTYEKKVVITKFVSDTYEPQKSLTNGYRHQSK
jgi:hypothetical protein